MSAIEAEPRLCREVVATGTACRRLRSKGSVRLQRAISKVAEAGKELVGLARDEKPNKLDYRDKVQEPLADREPDHE